ncbi:SDR family oxidoreductase [soil metagenome]
MNDPIHIIGYGPVGQALAERLCAAGHPVVVAQRSRPATLPPGAQFRPCDVLDPASVNAACAGAGQVVLAIGLPYDSKVWARDWPIAMANTLDACEAAGARMLLIDNLYMYGPQTAPLTEDMPLSGYGAKPRTRAQVTRLWRAASDEGRVVVAALRAPDFYGPGVGLSHLGDAALGALAKGKAAMSLMPPDTPHAYAYVPDFARAAESLLDAPDSDWNQAWHVPCAPTTTPRALMNLAADALGVKLRITSIPFGLLPLMGLFVPFVREVWEMRFIFDRPYRVDASKFARRFWSDATPFEVGVPAAALSFRAKPS